jgi:1-acyl-sn-glycerol-3-phosphate acyltransferase
VETAPQLPLAAIERTGMKKSWAYRFIVVVARPLMMIFTRRVWAGGEKLLTKSGIIIVSNHTSNFDPLVLAHFINDNGRLPQFLAKAEVFKLPVAGAILRASGQIPVHRRTSLAPNALSDAEAVVKAGGTAVIYPEGTLTFDPNLWPMTGQSGAARLALATKAPLFPVAQWGAHKVIPRFRKGLKLIPPQTLYVTCGDEVDLSDLYDKEVNAELLALATERIMDALTRVLAEIRKETPPLVRWDRREVNEVGNL